MKANVLTDKDDNPTHIVFKYEDFKNWDYDKDSPLVINSLTLEELVFDIKNNKL